MSHRATTPALSEGAGSRPASPSGVIDLADVAGRRDLTDVADVVIIGSGAAGATAARVLTEAGVDVVLIEEGPLVPPGSLGGDLYGSFRAVWRDLGFQVARGRAITPILQGRAVGGTTVINGAIIHRLPEVIHRGWCEERGVAPWLSYGELSRVWDQLDRELSVGAAPEEVRGGNNRLMERGVHGVGLRGNWIRRNVEGCRGAAACTVGCPTGRRQSMDVSFVPRALRAGARLYARCRAERLLREGGRAVGVVARFRDPVTGERGPRLEVRARHAVIVAASAIQTPLFLRANGVGRASGLVGERLQAHPGTAVMGLFDDVVDMGFGATQGYESTALWAERMKFEAVGMPPELAAVRLPGFGRDLAARVANYRHLALWGVQLRAEAMGSVRRVLGRTSVRFALTPHDVATLKRGVFLLVEMMFAAGAREVYPGVHGLPEVVRSVDEVRQLQALPDDPRLLHCIAAHLFGTAVMGRGPSSSVVAPTLEAHELERLYVLDSSVFPSNLGVNPQHSISAVAWLAAERIAERVRAAAA